MQEELGLDFVGDSQLNLTPFQRQVFEAEKVREAEAQEEKMEQARNPGSSGGGRRMNSKNSQSPPTGSSDLSRSETVRYINDSDDGDEDTLSVID